MADAPLQRYLKAVLTATGELGYDEVSVLDVATRAGSSPEAFGRHFASVEECFAAAYEAWSECLCEGLLEAGSGGESWVDGLYRAIAKLFSLVEREPTIARAMLVEVGHAEPPTLQQRREVVERLSRAIDGARRESMSRHSSSPLTGTFIVGAIEFVVCRQLVGPKPEPRVLWSELPELMHFAVLPYRGEEAAWAAHDMALARHGGRTRSS